MPSSIKSKCEPLAAGLALPCTKPTTNFSRRLSRRVRLGGALLTLQEVGTAKPPKAAQPEASPYLSQSASAGAAAFTLLEVIVAMGILSMLVLLMTNLFQEVSFSWNIGTQSAEMNTAGRTAIEFMARELAQAVAGPIESADVKPAQRTIGFSLEAKEVKCGSLSGQPDRSDGSRALMGSTFWLDEATDTLKYRRETASFRPYEEDPGAGGSVSVLIENATDFQLKAFATEADLISGNGQPSYSSTNLPVCVDIMVEVISLEEANKYKLGGAPKADILRRSARRYTTRVYFNNRPGWQARP